MAARMREQHGHRYSVVARSLGWDGFAYLDPDTALVRNGTVLFFDEVPRDKLSRIVVREPLAPEVVDEMRTQLRVAVTEAKAGPCWALIKHGTSWTFSAGADQLRVKLPCEEDSATARLETLIDRSWTACGW
jgi:hypothetical protein